jgi:multisubunit Na+/H+ antiporter MnhG subunit
MARRTAPLTARPFDVEAEPELAPPPPVVPPQPVGTKTVSTQTVEAQPGAEASRFQRLADGVKGLRVGGGTLNLGERTLMILGGIIAPLGLALVIIGWYGAAHTPNLYEQIPYMVSGGLFGLGLVFIGSFFYFAHWITELVKEGRGQSVAMVEAIARLEETVRQQAGADRAVLASSNGVNAEEASRTLVATSKGTMAHRPDCVVVTGKPGLRTVTVDDALEPCKLCDPYAELEPEPT